MFTKSMSLCIVLLFVFSCFVLADIKVSDLNPTKYQVKPISVGLVYYVDRTYTINSFPDELKDALVILTGKATDLLPSRLINLPLST